MEFITGMKPKDTWKISEILQGDWDDREVKVNGMVHTLRDMGEILFLVLRSSEGLVQCVTDEGKIELADTVRTLKEGTAVKVSGMARKESRAPQGVELQITKILVLSAPDKNAMIPLPIAKRKLNTSLETKLNLRPISLRNLRERAIFKLQEGIVRGFRDFLFKQHFTDRKSTRLNSSHMA